MQPINLIMIYYWDKKLKKRLHVLEADLIIITKSIDLMSLAQRMHFLQNMFRMTAIVLRQHLNLSSKVVSHPDALIFWYGVNLLIDGHFEYYNGLWIVLIHVVLQEPPEIKNLWGSDKVNVETTRACSACWSVD